MGKKLLVFLLIGVFIMSTAAGCITANIAKEGDKTESSGQTAAQTEKPLTYGQTGELPITNEPVTITCLVPDDNPQPKETWFSRYVQEVTGINLIVEGISSYDYAQKLELLLASKKLPDIFYSNTLTAEKYGPLGVLANVNNNLDILPTFKEIWEKEEYIRKNSVSSDGNLYFFPIYKSARILNHGFLYRKDIFDKHNIPNPPDGPDEWFNALSKLKEIYPDSTPFVSKNQASIFSYMFNSWGNCNVATGSYFGYSHESDSFIFGPATEEWKEMLRYLNKLMENGLLDPEFLTSSLDDWTAKMTQEAQAFATWDWVDRMVLLKDAVKDRLPDYNLRYAYPMGPTGTHYSLSQVSSDGYSISTSCENVEIALQLCDWFYSDEGSRATTMGKEGVTFENENGKITYPEIAAAGYEVAMNSLRDMYGLYRSYLSFHPECIYFDYHDGLKEAVKMMSDGDRFLPLPPSPILETNEREESQELYPALKKATEQYSAQVIFGEKNLDDDWTAWLKEAEQLGYKKVEEIYYNAYERLKKK